MDTDKFNADRATFSAKREIMAKARAKAKKRRQKFSTYIAALVELDVLGNGTATNPDDLLFSAAEDVAFLRKEKPAYFHALVSHVSKGEPFAQLVSDLDDLDAENILRLRRGYALLNPTAVSMGLGGSEADLDRGESEHQKKDPGMRNFAISAMRTVHRSASSA